MFVYMNLSTFKKSFRKRLASNLFLLSFRVLGGWLGKRREGEIAYGRCYERSAWKSLYLRKKQIISNWRSRAIQSRAVLEYDNQISFLKIHSGRIYAASHHRSLRVWNVDDAQPVFTLNLDASSTLQVSDDGKYIVSGPWDATARVWCGQTGVQLHVLRGHKNRVACMSLHGTILVSGSLDQTLRVWDIVDEKCLQILAGHLDWVCCVEFDGERVVSSSRDFTVKVWNVHTGECLHTLTGHPGPVTSLLFEPDQDLVVSGSWDRMIRVWDVRRGTCILHIVVSKDEYLRLMQLRGNILAVCYSGSDVWDIRDGGSCIHRLQGTKNGHTRFITSLQWLDSGLLVTASEAGVDLWDVDKGILVRELVGPGTRSYISGFISTETLLVCVVASRDRTAGKLLLFDFGASYP